MNLSKYKSKHLDKNQVLFLCPKEGMQCEITIYLEDGESIQMKKK